MENKKFQKHDESEEFHELKAVRKIRLTREEKGAIFHTIMSEDRITEKVGKLMNTEFFDDEIMPVR